MRRPGFGCLAVEAGIVLFRVAFNRWPGAADKRETGEFVAEACEELKALTAGAERPGVDGGFLSARRCRRV